MIRITKISDRLVDSLESVFEFVRDNSELQVDISTCSTFGGIQSHNLVYTQYVGLLNQILQEAGIQEHYILFHAHSIEYGVGGYQTPHNHPPDDYSFVLYFDTEKTGSTVLELKDEVLHVDQIRGNLVMFSPDIIHSGSPVYTKKRILVGALKNESI